MEVTRQLRLRQLTQAGLAQIQLTYCWDGHRLRTGSGQRVAPKDWDGKRERVRPRPDAYADTINPILDRYQLAAEQLHQQAQAGGQPLLLAQAKARIQQRYEDLLAAEQGRVSLPAPPAAVLTLLDHYARWVSLEAEKVSARTGRRLSSTTLWTHQAVGKELAAFAAHRQRPLTFEGLDQAFYDGLRNYMLGPAGRSPRTFNTYVKRLRSFLFWAEGEGLPVPAHVRRVLRLAPSYVGKDALTQDELLRVAALDFAAPATQAYLAAAFPEPVPRPTGSGGRNGLSSAEHALRCQWVRDLFLLCAYTSLRAGDAQQLTWDQVHPEQELIRRVLNKTDIAALIPYLDDDVFRPVALLAHYRPLGLATCLPFVRDPWLYLPHVAALTQFTRFKLGLHVGRKTYATLKVYQGVPKSLVMLATGHQTEAQFNVYLGIDEQELLRSHRLTARRLPKAA